MRQRSLELIMRQSLAENRQMLFLTGPRQVGKTTLARRLSAVYCNTDNLDDRRTLLAGPAALAARANLHDLQKSRPVIALDELHKLAQWKNLLKGFFDTYGDRCRVVVTGSTRLDVFRRGGDSLMGRYFLHRMHPLTVGELLRAAPPDEALTRPPRSLSADRLAALWRFGGFPEPFEKQSAAFHRKWLLRRNEQLLRDDVRELTRVQELSHIELLATLLAERSGSQVVYSSLAREIGVTVDTIRRWLELLARLYFGFLVRPWFKNISKALRKEPKWFLRDWSGIADDGARFETLTACHLLKAAETWTDAGLGEFELRYIRDALQNEVDFLLLRDRRPWLLVECKLSRTQLSPSLMKFQKLTAASHAFQAVWHMDYVDADCFAETAPTVVPAQTLLSQLL
jgi:predicted AAA+ superfamily ATPase